jgi:hypothetical protein
MLRSMVLLCTRSVRSRPVWCLRTGWICCVLLISYIGITIIVVTIVTEVVRCP